MIILAGGNSHRFKSNIGKPYQKIGGKSLIEINLIKARKFKEIRKIVLVYNKKDSKRVSSLKLKNINLVIGGKNRQRSTFNALKYLINQKSPTNILIHDVARPNFSTKLLSSILRNMRNARAVVPKIKKCKVTYWRQNKTRIDIQCLTLFDQKKSYIKSFNS